MGSTTGSLAWTAIVVLAYMTGWFAVALAVGRNDIVDVAWGLGFVVIAWSLVVRGPVTSRLVLVTVLATIWGVRLARYIHVRNRGKGEDFRYKKWRDDWGRWFVPRSYLQVFLLQGLFMVMISAPLWVVAGAPERPLGAVAVAGGLVWAFGFLFETVGDAQMSAFKSDPANKGTLIDVGLWRYTRHPNYFGEVVLWWGLWLIALPVEHGWIAALGPLTITALLLGVSGIPMLERRYAGRPDWEAYKERTSAFIPLPPRRVPRR